MGIELPNPRNIFMPAVPTGADVEEIKTHLTALNQGIEDAYVKLFDDIQTVANLASTSTSTGTGTGSCIAYLSWPVTSSDYGKMLFVASATNTYEATYFTTLPEDTALKSSDLFVIEDGTTPAIKDKVSLATITTYVATNIIYHNYIEFTTGSSSWTCPSGISTVLITGCGGGGGGGGGSGQYNLVGAGGGAAGKTVIRYPYAVTSGNSYDIVIGAGGGGGAAGTSGGSDGTAGGNSSFASFILYGGAAGKALVGTGATAYGGTDTTNYPGISFPGANATTMYYGGLGANGLFGGGGSQGYFETTGGNGSGYGGGGGGGGSGNVPEKMSRGGTGAGGCIQIQW